MTFNADIELPSDLGPWAIVANIVKHDRGGPDPSRAYRGTRVFSPGAKIYIGSMDGGAFSNFGVLGQNRVSKKLSTCMVDIKTLENLRSKVIYDKKVLQKLLWTQFMPVWQRERPEERNVGAGRWCLFKDKVSCELALSSIQSELNTIAAKKLK
jgi:hypothetical protein